MKHIEYILDRLYSALVEPVNLHGGTTLLLVISVAVAASRCSKADVREIKESAYESGYDNGYSAGYWDGVDGIEGNKYDPTYK